MLAAVVSTLSLIAADVSAEPAAETVEAYAALTELGFALNSGITLPELVAYEFPRPPGVRFITRSQLEEEMDSGTFYGGIVVVTERPAEADADRTPAGELVWKMGGEYLPADFYTWSWEERQAYEPRYFSDNVAAIDFEGIANSGDYSSLLYRLSRLGDGVVEVNNAEDRFPWIWLVELGLARSVTLEFEFAGAVERWTMVIDQDWVDPLFFVRFDQLVETADPSKRLYSFNDGGQSDLFFIASPSTAADLARLVGEPVRDWRSFRGEIQ